MYAGINLVTRHIGYLLALAPLARGERSELEARFAYFGRVSRNGAGDGDDDDLTWASRLLSK